MMHLQSAVFLFVVVVSCCAFAANLPGHAVPYDVSQRVVDNQLVSRIHNGFPARANQFPYQVAVRIPVGSGAFVCGGSIISPSWVLTAAHCLDGRSQVNLRFGSINFNSGGTSRTSFQFFGHPAYNPSNLNNDIALIAIPTPVVLSIAIQPVRMPTLRQATATFVEATAVVSGWGATHPGGPTQNQLRWVNTRVITNAQCQRTFGGSVVAPHVVCTLGFSNPNQGTCGGDSGGPLVVDEDGVDTQIGVVAFGAHPNIGGCSAGHPTGYMRTASFLDWMNRHTGIPIRQ